jgi:hypothetical protein
MNFIKFLIEADQRMANEYSQFFQDYKNAVDSNVPSAQKLLGLLNRRLYTPGQSTSMDFITKWFMDRGYLTQKGNMVIPTKKGSELRQSLAHNKDITSDNSLKKAVNGGYKDLRRFFIGITDEATREFLSTLNKPTLDAIALGRELDQEDIAILNGIRERAENHKERSFYVNSMKEKNPDRLDKLESLGLIDKSTGSFNKKVWDNFVNEINSLDPARVRTLIPSFFQWSIHKSGNTARNINKILFAIHPSSRNRATVGSLVWNIINNLDQNTFDLLKNGKKPKQNNLNDESYKLLTTVVPLVINAFPNATSSETLINQINDAFDSRVDFKSLNRSSEKVNDRRNAAQSILQQY